MQEWRPMPLYGGEQPVYILPGTTPRKGLPTWLMAPGVALIVIAVLFGFYKMIGGKTEPAATAPGNTESAASEPAAQASPYAKFLEVTGVRFAEDAQQHTRVQMVVVNHSPSDLPALELRVTLRASSAKPDDPPVAVVQVKPGELAANGSKDITAPLTTKLRAYELPDWQFLRATAEVIGPK
jgi:hypothetical protein